VNVSSWLEILLIERDNPVQSKLFREYYYPIQLSSWVALSRWRLSRVDVGGVNITSSLRLPTDSVDNLETDQTDSIAILIDIDNLFKNDVIIIMLSLVTNLNSSTAQEIVNWVTTADGCVHTGVGGVYWAYRDTKKTGKQFTIHFFTRDSLCYSAYMPRQFRPSVCLSHACIVSKRLNVSSKFLHYLIGPSF